MSDGKLSLVLFDIGFVLMLISMVIGPFGITNWALSAAAAACFLALAAMSFAFQCWDEDDADDDREEDKRDRHLPPQ